MNRIKELRECKQVKQADLAKTLNVSQGTLSNWERGVHDPDNKTVSFLADYFNVSADYIIGRTDDKVQTSAKKDTSHEVSDEEIMFALFGDDTEEITDEMFEDVKRFAQFIKEKKKKSVGDGSS